MNNFVVPHNPDWAHAFNTETQQLHAAMGANNITLHHIGSTAIAGILAKPIIDLLGIVDDFDALDSNSKQMESLGYEVMGAFGINGRRYFRKINAQGLRTHHLHIYEQGSDHIERHIAFRDYLRAHPAIAAAYSSLKHKLTSHSTATWEGYLDGKDPFIQTTEQDALRWYHSL